MGMQREAKYAGAENYILIGHLKALSIDKNTFGKCYTNSFGFRHPTCLTILEFNIEIKDIMRHIK